MHAYFNFLNQLTTKNHEKYNTENTNSSWFKPYSDYVLEETRQELIQNIAGQASWSFKATKPWINRLSKGCEICGQGDWSCLFITGQCNAACFYCPTAQNLDVPPGTQSGDFHTAIEYAAYINRFKFKGVSFSGGEPLLTFDKTLEYIKAVREECDPHIYIWVYTNGILLTREKALKLAEAGINEIRFDIGANGYSLEAIKLARDLIPVITVEIPAVPQELEKLKQLIPEMILHGVSNLNLHQLRLTSYNHSRLSKRGYTYLHGEHPCVAESELTALKIIEFVAHEKLNIGINYCAFQYKHRFQKAGYRKKIAELYRQQTEEITENGYLRIIEKNGIPITFGQLINTSGITEPIQVTYKAGKIDQSTDQKSLIKLPEQPDSFQFKSGIIFKATLLPDDIEPFVEIVTNPEATPPQEQSLFEIWRLERIEHGWRDFF